MKVIDLTDILKDYSSQVKFFQKLSRDCKNLKIVKKYIKNLSHDGTKNRDLTSVEIFTLLIILIDAEQDPELVANMLITSLTNKFASLFDMTKMINQAGILNQENFEILLNAQNIRKVGRALIYLNEAKILTVNNTALLTSKADYTEAIIALYKERLLDQENLDACKNSPCPERAVHAFKTLRIAGILTAENKKAVLVSYPLAMTNVLIELNKASLLTPENREILCDFPHKNHFDKYAKCFAMFNDFDILSQENFESLLKQKDKNVKDYGLALLLLEKEYIATKEHRALLLSTNKPKLMAEALILLKNNRIISPENVRLLRGKNENCYKIASILSRLKIVQLLTVSQRVIINSVKHFPNQIIELLQEANLLTQENFRIVMRYAAVFDYIDYTHLNCHMLTRTVFSHLIESCIKSGSNINVAISEIDAYIEKLANLQQLVTSALASQLK